MVPNPGWTTDYLGWHLHDLYHYQPMNILIGIAFIAIGIIFIVKPPQSNDTHIGTYIEKSETINDCRSNVAATPSPKQFDLRMVEVDSWGTEKPGTGEYVIEIWHSHLNRWIPYVFQGLSKEQAEERLKVLQEGFEKINAK